MGFLRNMLNNFSINRYRKELLQFIENLKVMNSDEMAFLVYSCWKTQGFFLLRGIDLLSPFEIEAEKPAYCTEFADIIRMLQKERKFVAAGACMPFLHTLRAAHFIELRGLCREMWAELARGMDNPTVSNFPDGFTPQPI